jgi:hypothetical protein
MPVLNAEKLWLIDRQIARKIKQGQEKSPPPGNAARFSHMSSGLGTTFPPFVQSSGPGASLMETSRAIPESHPLHRLFRGLTEYAFMSELGIGDPSLVGYVAELLASFVPSHGVWRLRDAQGRPFLEVTAMVAAAEAAGDAASRRECHRHVGDFTLFWTGVYPEALAKLQGKHSPDALISFQQQGKRSYHLASVLSTGNDQGPVFRRLSEQFELCAFGLSRVRREWEKFEAEGPSAGASSRPVVL